MNIEEKFQHLLSLDLSDKIEKRKNNSIELNYLSWSYAWAEFKKVYPNAYYEIKKFPLETNEKNCLVPYMYDENTGYMVMTEVIADDITYEMWLPVMDSNNRAMKNKPYTITTKAGKEINVESATMFDVNKTIMRCLVKNLAMFGLGLYIYAGEDLPDNILSEEEKDKKNALKSMSLIEKINECKNDSELEQIYRVNKKLICSSPELLSLITKKGEDLKAGK